MWIWSKQDFDLRDKFQEDFANCFPEIEIYDDKNSTWQYYENRRNQKSLKSFSL